MPRIQDYSTQVSAEGGVPDQQATPQDFGAGIAATAGQGATEIGNTLQDVAQRQEVSDVHAKLAQARAQWTVELANRATEAPAGDTAFIDKFQTDFSDYLAQSGGNYRTAAGQRAWKEGAAELAAHFTQSAGLYAVKSAGDKALVDYGTLLDSNRSVLFQDPSQFQSVLKSTTAALNDPNGLYAKLPADKRYELAQKTQDDLAMSAIQGLIRIDPDEAKRQWDSGQWSKYIPAGKDYVVTGEIETGILARERDAQRAQAAKDKADEAHREAVASDFVSRLVADPTSVSAKEIAASDLKPTTKLQWVGPGGILDRAMANKKMATDPAVFTSLFQRIHAPDSDPSRITNPDDLNAYVGKGLDISSLNQLRAEIAGRRTPDGQTEADMKKVMFETARSTLTKSNSLTGVKDPKGDENLLRFMSYFLPEYQKQRQAGKSPADLLNPDSPDYLGKQLAQYKRPFNQVLLDLIDANPDNPTVVGGERPAATGGALPAPLRSIKGLLYSPSRKQYRDPATGKIYDASGNEVK